MGRDLQMRRSGAPLLPGWVLCDCGFADVGATDVSVCRRPHDRHLDEALARVAPTVVLGPRTHERDTRRPIQYGSGYFRAGGIVGLWDAMEEAGVDDPREVDYGHTISAERARRIAEALTAWVPKRRAALADVDAIVQQLEAAVAFEEDFALAGEDRGELVLRGAVTVRDERDRAYDELRWVERFAAYNDLAALFDGYSIT